MSVDRQKVSNWWFSLNSIQRSLLLSLLIHMLVALGLLLGAFPVVEKMMAAVVPELIDLEALEMQQQKRQQSVIFLEVPASIASEDAPEDSKYYSTQNSRAADEQSEKETPQPKIEGTQDKVPRIIDSKPASPAKPTPPEPKPETPEPKPKPPPPKAETLNPIVAKPEPKVEPKPEPEPKPRRPRTVAEAKQLAMVQGQKMKQDGGVKKRATIVGLDAKASPFGDYDARLIAAIQNRWNQILDQYYLPSVGQVVLTFNLWSDGKVTNVQVERSTVNTILALKCERAVKEPSPYAPWPEKMHDEIGSDRRFVRFTFYYN
jgi:outer membrane biosynthesis protein TonB